MKRILLFNCFIVGLFIVLFLGVTQAFAQTSAQKTPEQIAAEKGITFPIAELGNCNDFNACRTFCEDPVNQNTCIDFAKKKGFHKEEATSNKEAILKSAITELGCNSEDSCRVFCSQEANHNKCIAFAQKHNLGGGEVHDPSKGEILNKAKEVLGCSSYESCRSYCENEANIQKCSEFARQTGLRGGEQIEGPGGCNSPDSCKTFCSDPNNYEICSKFHSAASGQTFQGPGGCNSEESCRTYCEKNPSACENIGGASEANHAEYCNKTPNCSWTGSTCQCTSTGGVGDYEKYCQENPDKCQVPYSTPTGNINPEGVPNYSPYPTSSPSTGGYDPAAECTKSPGCSWTGSSCQCSSTGGSTQTTQPTTQTTTQTATPPPSYDPAAECTKTPGCSWTGSTCTCGGVQGASTQKGWIETILEMLLRMK